MTHHLYILTGASRGLGLAMAQQLLLPGNHLLCISRQTQASLAPLAAQSSCKLEQWGQDLAQTTVAADRLRTWLLRPQPTPWASATLINNAGVIADPLPLSAAQAAGVTVALRVGLEAPMLLTMAFLNAFKGRGIPQRVLNISSGLGRKAMASQGPYCAAKAGMDHFTRCLALEEAARPDGARVCSIAPGVIDTDMQVQLRSAADADFPDRKNFDALKTQGQLTSPEAAASRLLAYLARPDFGRDAVADVREL